MPIDEPATALHTIEPSHGKPRLTQPRLSDVGTVGTADERSADHNANGTFANRNRAAANRSAKRALTAPLRAARTRLSEAVEGQGPSAADELLGAAMAIYGSAKLELGSTSVFVLANLVTFATETVLAGFFAKQAAEVGFDSPRGGELLELAHSCETHAQRAMTAALAAKKAIGTGKAAKRVIDAVEEAAAAEEAGQ